MNEQSPIHHNIIPGPAETSLRQPEDNSPLPEVIDPDAIIVGAAGQTVAGLRNVSPHAGESWRNDPDLQDESWAFQGSDPAVTPQAPGYNPVAKKLAEHNWTQHPATLSHAQAPQPSKPLPASEVPPLPRATPRAERRGWFGRSRKPEPRSGNPHDDFWAPIK